MKYYLIKTDDLDQIQFIPHPKRDVEFQGKIVELTEDEVTFLRLLILNGATQDKTLKGESIISMLGNIEKKFRKVLDNEKE